MCASQELLCSLGDTACRSGIQSNYIPDQSKAQEACRIDWNSCWKAIFFPIQILLLSLDNIKKAPLFKSPAAQL